MIPISVKSKTVSIVDVGSGLSFFCGRCSLMSRLLHIDRLKFSLCRELFIFLGVLRVIISIGLLKFLCDRMLPSKCNGDVKVSEKVTTPN